MNKIQILCSRLRLILQMIYISLEEKKPGSKISTFIGQDGFVSILGDAHRWDHAVPRTILAFLVRDQIRFRGHVYDGVF